MSTISIIYKLKSSNNLYEWNVEDVNIIKSALTQIQKWIASFNWILIHWIKSLEQLQILERSCDKYENWIYYIKVGTEQGNDMSYENVHDLIDWYEPNDKDITNDLFFELWIKWDMSEYKIDWEFREYILYIKWEKYPYLKNKKNTELLDIIYKCKIYYSNNILTYDQLNKKFEEWNYKELKSKDLCYWRVRDILKNKIKEIKDNIWIELMKFHTDKIVLWDK